MWLPILVIVELWTERRSSGQVHPIFVSLRQRHMKPQVCFVAEPVYPSVIIYGPYRILIP
jgi:hypothetical protein